MSDQKDNNGDEVQVTLKSVEETVSAKKGDSLMEVSKTEGWPIAFGCEDGMCGTCLVKSDGGLSEPNDVEKTTLEVLGLEGSGYRLACQCTVEGDTTIEQ